MTGTTVRTLHFYDEIGLLKPAFMGANGYRYYQQTQLVRLQQILFFKELDFDLKQIQAIFADPHFDHSTTLQNQKKLLLKKIARQKRMIKSIETTLTRIEQAKTMSPIEMAQELQTSMQKHIVHKFGEKGEEINREATAEVTANTAGWTWEKDWTPYITRAKTIITDFEALFNNGIKATSPQAQALAQANVDHGKLLQTLTKEKVLQNALLLRDKKFREISGGGLYISDEVACYIADAMEYFANKNL